MTKFKPFMTPYVQSSGRSVLPTFVNYFLKKLTQQNIRLLFTNDEWDYDIRYTADIRWGVDRTTPYTVPNVIHQSTAQLSIIHS